MLQKLEQRKNLSNNAPLRRVIAPLLALMMAGLISCSKREAANNEQKTFASPQEAGAALLAAAKTGNQVELMSIFGPDGKDLLFSGDAVKDKNTAKRFVAAYEQMNRWSKSVSGAEVLYIGADNFPFPIPLKQESQNHWRFDTAAGRDEVLARRIGDGELTAIGVLTEIATAQQEYFSQYHQFAQKFVSDEGLRNGLYWPVSEGQEPSPLGSLVEVARSLGYSNTGKPQPFNGYYYRILTQQGDAAPGGAKNYMTDGKLTGGFAVLAWPAKYQSSGIMTFVVSRDGVIHQKDLGAKTSETASNATTYDPGEGWTVILAPESTKSSASSSINYP